MVREGHQAKITASGFDWNFRWGANDMTCLWCYLSKVKRTWTSFREGWESGPLNFTDAPTSNTLTDVSVQLGNVYGENGKPIKEAEFEDWLKVYLHFNRPTDYIETDCGTIIFQEEFADKIYFKGLLHESTSAQREFRYGYDFSKLQVGRDGKDVQYLSLLEETLAEIWASAIKSHPKRKRILNLYIEMLANVNESRDVSWIAKNMSGSTAVAVWDKLQKRITRHKLFYYGPKDADKVRP
jgi:hypothetical protein